MFEAALAADPTLRELRGHCGGAHLALGRRAEGEAALRDELAHHPGEFWASKELAELFDRAGRGEEARKIRAEALSVAEAYAASNAGDVEVWRGIAHLRLSLGRVKDAEDALVFAVENARSPQEKAQFAIDLAQLLTALGRKEDGERRFRETVAAFEKESAAAADPAQRRALFAALGALARASGDLPAARAHYAAARRGAYGREAKKLDVLLKALAGR